ncbi:MAG: lysophospholipid acyltransferase family protein [Candidatus Omnitrophica bacterium]|nr:lysophospholipid acyltransferase family protein [Candidatus Omnitrophota bacterium]MBU1869506.1 lysophospholipid acyltransferase family protein [Candidatus Omnitrophota bacterium]
MDSKQIRKNFSRWAGWFGINFCSLIIRVIPSRYLYSFACAISSIGYKLASSQRKVGLESLRIAFGNEKSQDELGKIAKDSFTNMSKSAIELIFLIDKPAQLKDRIKISGKENLDQALSKGKGVILVSAHFGNFPLLLARLSQEGYKSSGIMRPMRDPRVEKMFFDKRMKYGVRTIYSQPRNTCVNETIEALRKNELVFIPIDQNFGTAGVFVDFFGRKAATATGPVIFAQRTKAALLPCFIIRQPDDTHKIVFEKPIDLKEAKTPEETILVNIQKLTDIIELYIRKFPAEWGWVHRRWKTKPK